MFFFLARTGRSPAEKPDQVREFATLLDHSPEIVDGRAFGCAEPRLVKNNARDDRENATWKRS